MRSVRMVIFGLVLVGAVIWSAAPIYALGRYEKVWLRDTAIGAGAGLAVSLVAERDTVNWVVAGAVTGAIFGYFDAEKGILSYTPERGWSAGAPVVNLDVEHTRNGDNPIVKALVVNAEW